VHSLLVKKEHPVIAPRLADAAEHESPPDQRMERMSHDNSPILTVALRRS
jgi:hypothetical protein